MDKYIRAKVEVISSADLETIGARADSGGGSCYMGCYNVPCYDGCYNCYSA